MEMTPTSDTKTASASSTTPWVTLADYLSAAEQSGDIPAALRDLLLTMGKACGDIADIIARGALAEALGSAGTCNVQGEEQKALDLLANDIIVRAAEASGVVAALASEEMEDIHLCSSAAADADYLLIFDPVDGSSNLDVNLSIGTIFSIGKWTNRSSGAVPSESDFLRAGRAQVAAGYAIYGPQTMLVFTAGRGGFGFTRDPDRKEFVLTHDWMRIPRTTREFAINASNRRHWPDAICRYIDGCLDGQCHGSPVNYNMRWTASMVADVHRILTRGGVFLYPADRRHGMESGKLRLLYEGSPMSFLVEQAGGAATDGFNSIMDLEPHRLHDRIPVFLGSIEEVEKIGAIARANGKPSA
ncbi:class 1 fructose-bisphosphatase [Sphingopyxis sp. R3-92]|uniref:class 1 fructose-bisphosphatase n=1 Tax=Sphingopyxis sp. R3-92 TaxID=3158553 RepID=UPI003EE62E06